MDFLPVFLNLRDRAAVIVGGGAIAARKAELLASAGPKLTVISIECHASMRELITRNGWRHEARAFREADLDGAQIVIAATDDAAVNEAVYGAAEARGIPVNVADQPELCSFILPAIIDRSPAIIAVSTGGRSPVLARYVKALLERQLPFGLANFTDVLGRWRRRVQASLPGVEQRRRFWQQIIDGPVGEQALAGANEATDQAIATALDSWETGAENSGGMVYLIGAGPGDPELLTLRGHRLLQRADVVLYDRLIPTRLLELCRREAELIYVGKQAASHVVSQQTIGELLVEHAQAGRCVARLKGGDPFVFGRGGEELEALISAGIDFQVVPGISAANGCAAYAGIPLTHRDHATGVSFWTGHMKDGELNLPWTRMQPEHHTHVFFMGLRSLPVICQQLIAHGAAAQTPAAMIAAGTTTAQEVVVGDLASLPELAQHAELPSPALLLVGGVVTLRSQIDWFRQAAAGDLAFPFPTH